jgi:hypothetical protein
LYVFWYQLAQCGSYEENPFLDHLVAPLSWQEILIQHPEVINFMLLPDIPVVLFDQLGVANDL